MNKEELNALFYKSEFLRMEIARVLFRRGMGPVNNANRLLNLCAELKVMAEQMEAGQRDVYRR